jgi:hypothetical protein
MAFANYINNDLALKSILCKMIDFWFMDCLSVDHYTLNIVGLLKPKHMFVKYLNFGLVAAINIF